MPHQSNRISDYFAVGFGDEKDGARVVQVIAKLASAEGVEREAFVFHFEGAVEV